MISTRSDAETAVDVRDSFCKGGIWEGESRRDGCRTSVNETSNRCSPGHIVNKKLIEASESDVCRSFNVRNVESLWSLPMPEMRLATVESV